MVVAVMVGMAGCGDGNPGGGNEPGKIVYNPDGTGGDSRLVGDWTVDAWDSDKQFIRFTSSGTAQVGAFGQVGDVWIEHWMPYVYFTKWRTEGEFIYTAYSDGDTSTRAVRYSISGNEMTWNECYYDDLENKEYCYETILTKADVNAIRSTLGIVYSTDPALYSWSRFGQNGLSWVLQGDESHVLEFDYASLNEDGRHYYSEDNYHNSCAWYTTGSNLILLYGISNYDDDDNRNFVLESTVELDYKITGTGNNKTLTIHRVLPDGTLSSADIWNAVEHFWHDNDDYDYAPTLGKRILPLFKAPPR